MKDDQVNLNMCNSCICDWVEKCSVQGNAPIGWCCGSCTSHELLNIQCDNQFENTITREILTIKDFLLNE